MNRFDKYAIETNAKNGIVGVEGPSLDAMKELLPLEVARALWTWMNCADYNGPIYHDLDAFMVKADERMARKDLI
jgi:hypothetical protein